MYRSMIKMYYRGIHAAIIVFDLCERKSFESVEHWFKDIREKQQAKLLSKKNELKKLPKQCIYYVVGNKSDLAGREVSEEEV